MRIRKGIEWFTVTVWWRYFKGYPIDKLLKLLNVIGGGAGIWPACGPGRDTI